MSGDRPDTAWRNRYVYRRGSGGRYRDAESIYGEKDRDVDILRYTERYRPRYEDDSSGDGSPGRCSVLSVAANRGGSLEVESSQERQCAEDRDSSASESASSWPQHGSQGDSSSEASSTTSWPLRTRPKDARRKLRSSANWGKFRALCHAKAADTYRESEAEESSYYVEYTKDLRGELYWDTTTQDYTDTYFERIIDDDAHEQIADAVEANEERYIEGLTPSGARERFSMRVSDDETWAYRPKSRRRLPCPPRCPLREPLEYLRDPTLPMFPNFPSIAREGACNQLYGRIGEWQTRILILEPGRFGTELVAQLAVADMIYLSGIVLHEAQKRVEFTALSYTWGAAVFPRTVTINGIAFPVTENLFAFLQRYRDKSNARYLWIDYLSINQMDLEEKSVQVGNMLTIYEKAAEVIVWLGEEIASTKLAVEFIRWARSHSKMNVQHDQDNDDQADFEEFPQPNEMWHSDICARSMPSVLHGIEDLCSRNWVRRIWVKQEIWAAKNVHVYCGSSRLTWDEFMHGPGLILRSSMRTHDKPTLPAEEAECFRNLGRRGDISGQADSDSDFGRGPVENEDEPCEIMALLNESASCQCTEPLDRVYALLGMASKPRPDSAYANIPPPRLSIDYKKAMEAVFSELAMSIMLLTGPHSILAAITTFGDYEGLSLPSWTPDFRQVVSCGLKGDLAAYAPSVPVQQAVKPKRSRRKERYEREDWGRQRERLRREEVHLRQFRQLNGGVGAKLLRFQGIRLGELVDDLTGVKLDWEVCLGRRGRDEIEIRDRFPKPERYHQFLKPMSCRVCSWIAWGDRGLEDDDPTRDYPFKAFLEYHKEFRAMAVPRNARRGDYLAAIPLLPTPVILRKSPQHDGQFLFLGCAWCYHGRGDFRFRTVMQDFMDAEYLDPGWELFGKRLELFVVE